MITFSNVNKSFQEDFWKKPKKVLKDLSFVIPSGSLCGFLGANGSGKTTSIKSTLGFINIDSGSISFEKELGTNFKEVRSRIGYFPESPYFYSFMTGREFCHYLGSLQGTSKENIQSQIKTWGDQLNISYALDQKIRGYSKGMLQRLGFLSSLIHDPQLIILDEPLSGLDPIGRKEFKDTLVSLNKNGKTIFFSSHIVSDVEEICDELIVIQDGQLFFSGRTDDLLSQNSNSEFTVSFLRKEGLPELDILRNTTELGSGSIRGYVAQENRDDFLSWVHENRVTLLEFRLERPSLEKVVYKTNEERSLN